MRERRHRPPPRPPAPRRVWDLGRVGSQGSKHWARTVLLTAGLFLGFDLSGFADNDA